VRGDANRLRQIIWHLLANAIKFTPRGGVIVLKVETNDHVHLTVRDNGPGIAEDFLPRIFDRFSQADSSPTRSAGGLGVGLSLVRELIERHAASTGSAFARRVLDAWPMALQQFVCVMPREFKRARSEAAAESRGLVA
jgi:signal transduction histidine kinase